jgi:hypothetical protein
LDNFNDILASFEPISLEEMDNVKLMTRKDTKFTMHVGRLGEFLEASREKYRVLEINACRRSRYESVYLDTPDFFFYHQHHSGRLNRLKVRMRHYLESDDSFLEIKFKNNKFKTHKKRRKIESINTPLASESMNYLEKNTGYKIEDLEPKIVITYIRTTLVSKTKAERVTIDTNLAFEHNQTHIEIPNLAIVEIKQENNGHSAFAGILHNARVKSVGISKYCFGITNIYKEMKMNNFKEKIRLLNKIEYDSNRCH